MRNVLSIDLESWVHFVPHAVRDFSMTKTGDDRRRLDDGYAERATRVILDRLAAHGRRATFFVVSEVHDWCPGLVDELRDRGHEIGFHTHTHRILRTVDDLREELELGRAFLERFRPAGFRAPMIHLPDGSVDLLRDHGSRYSSSTYGTSEVRDVGGLDEIPVSAWAWRRAGRAPPAYPEPMTVGLLTRKIPYGSGLFVATLGRATSSLIRRHNRRGEAAALFLHPWQLVQTDPFAGPGFKARVLLRNPVSLPYTRHLMGVFETLLERHDFTSYEESVYG